jgi:hypothetical protein
VCIPGDSGDVTKAMDYDVGWTVPRWRISGLSGVSNPFPALSKVTNGLHEPDSAEAELGGSPSPAKEAPVR